MRISLNEGFLDHPRFPVSLWIGNRGDRLKFYFSIRLLGRIFRLFWVPGDAPRFEARQWSIGKLKFEVDNVRQFRGLTTPA